jgi:Zn-dependent protease with chaperone function
LSPLTPVLIAGVVYAARRWSPLHGHLEKREQAHITARYAELPADHPLQIRVAQIAARMDSPVPRVFLAPPRTGEINIYAVGNINRARGAGGFLVLPASMFTSLRPGLPSVFTAAEQDAVIAHEMSHIRHQDSQTLLLTNTGQKLAMFGYLLAAVGVVMGAVAAGPLWVATGAFMGAMVLSRMCSRQVEFRADSEALTASGNALALATALEKLEKTGRHLEAFARNAQDIAQDDGERGWITVFRARKVDAAYRAPELSPMAKFFMRYLSTHPERTMRYDHLRARAAEEGQGALPEKPPSVDREMAPHLLRTTDGIILPPFAIPETVVRDMGKDQIAVATGLKSTFNAAARGESPSMPAPPPRKPGGQPPAPGPWG